MSTPTSVVGIVWYRREDYPSVRALMADGDLLPATWEEWFQRAKRVRDEGRAKGHIVEQVYIDPDTFPDWCRRNGHDVDAKGRNAFANLAAHEHARKNVRG